MNKELIVRNKREFGEVITDSFKIIFRNLQDISMFYGLYTILPMTVALLFIFQLQINYLGGIEGMNLDQKMYPILFTIMAGFFGYLHMNLSSAVILLVGDEAGAEKIEFSELNKKFLGFYKRNLIFHAETMITFAFILIVFGIITVAIPPLGFSILVIFAFSFFLYLYPLIHYSYMHYLMDNNLTVFQSFIKGKEFLTSSWGESIGVIFVTGIINNFLQYSIIIPYMLVALLMGTSTSYFENPDNYAILTTIQNLIISFFLTFLLLYSSMSLLLKFYDILERKTGSLMIEKIDAIGMKKDLYFENEGDL